MKPDNCHSIKNVILGFLFFMTTIITSSLSAQTITGSIKGNVWDKVTKTPLPGANIVLLNTDPMTGTASDPQGGFSIHNIPVGRYDIKASFIGYESIIVPEVIVGSGKAAVLNIELKEQPVNVDDIVVKATTTKDNPQNDMVLVSGRMFTVEEARRYAGGIDDPARLATSFAGVATASTSDDNSIVVRGNSPRGILWRLEGIEVPNPNHFFGTTSFGGGGVSAMSAMMLDNSDFLTGAFPAEYGNALSGVFDLKLKTGNTENHEHAFQLGMMGIDFASEGPLSKNNRSSYAFNYRYSTLGLVSHFIQHDMSIPFYQDLSFKIKVPTKKMGIFSIWGIGFLDEIAKTADQDTSTWIYDEDAQEIENRLNMGTVAVAHKMIFGKKAYLNSTLAFINTGIKKELSELDVSLNAIPHEFVDSKQRQWLFSTDYYYKFSARHYNKTGLSIKSLTYDLDIKNDQDYTLPMEQIVAENGSSQFFRGYTQSDFRIKDNISATAGLNLQYFAYNQTSSLEPRSSIRWKFQDNQSLSFGYGLHSRWENLGLYMARNSDHVRPNKNLKLTRAHHIVLGYDINLTRHTRLKIEPYYQSLFDVPVIPDSSYSLLNMQGNWYLNQKLENSGTGTNTGIDITLERYLYDNYYYLVTASLFDSKYTGGDDVERNTRFNRNYVVNVLGGKEWIIGKNKNKIFGINVRFQLMGGDRRNPLDIAQSLKHNEIIYNKSNPFAIQGATTYHTHITFTYRVNGLNHASIWGLQLYNFPGSSDFLGYNYNFDTQVHEEDKVYVFFPMLSYKIEF